MIPKFASFRPKAPPESPDHEDGASKCSKSPVYGRIDSADKSTVKRSHRRHSSDTNHSNGRHEHEAKAERKSQLHLELSDVTSKRSENTTAQFVVDRLGDPKNLIFGAPDRYSTPSYFRIGTGNVLGSSSDHKIDRNVSNEKGLVLSNRDSPKKADRISLGKVDERGTRELKIKPRAYPLPDIDVAASFVPLTTVHRKKRKRDDSGSGSGSSSTSAEEDTYYRSIEGKAKQEDRPTDRDLIYGSDMSHSHGQEEDRSSTLEETVQNRRIYLSRKVEAQPTNCSAWLNLISHQDKILGLNMASERTGLTGAEKRSNADVKLSMYEKALEKITDSEDRENLLLGMIDEATRVWESQKLLSRWKSVLESNPGSLKLWTKFLDFKQTSFLLFTYEEVRTVYLDCLSILECTQNTTRKRITEKEEIHEIQVYVLLRLTVFMRESGFPEHATAAWQAVLEYEYLRPDHFQNKHGGPSHQDTISSFEEFWDSEVPRLGENGCEGWKSFCARQGEPPEPKKEIAGTLEDSPNLWASWLTSERTHGLLAREPARTMDDLEENDPYRVILFTDVRPFLIDSPTAKSREVLLDAFVLFCQLPRLSVGEPSARSRLQRKDPFLRNEVLDLPDNMLRHWGLHCSEQQLRSLGYVEAQRDLSDQKSFQDYLCNLPMAEYQVSSDCLFSTTGSWFSPFDAWQNAYAGGQGPLRGAWVLRAFKALVMKDVGGDSLAEYSLAIELRLSPETIKKTARSLLKRQPSNLRFYNAYALIEYRLGNPGKGENTFVTSINMSRSLDENAQQDSILLWRTWIWELLSAGKTREALERLLAYGDEQASGILPNADHLGNQVMKPALLLRAEKALTATRDHMLSRNQHTHASLAMECLILFTYLRNSQSLTAATSAFKSNLKLLPQTSQSTIREYLHQSFSHLLYHYVTHTHLFKPSDVRSLLAESIAQFPQNTIFLSLYSWNEARFRIDDRVRSIMKDVVLASGKSKTKQQESIIPHFFAIYTELERSVTFGSNASTIRSTFERAVGSDSGLHCAGLWKLYFLFEQSRGDIARGKTVFWRGVRACPWAKGLYLLAFECLRGVMGDADLRGIYELMGEKELRVHVGLEHIFEEMDERKRIRQES